MQVERYPDQMAAMDERKDGLHKLFDEPEPFEAEKLESLLEDPTVKEVRVFKATPSNMKFAELRSKYPAATRKQLRRLMKRK